MKRLFALLIIAGIILLSACGGDDSPGLPERERPPRTSDDEGLITPPPDTTTTPPTTTEPPVTTTLPPEPEPEPLTFVSDEAEELFNLLMANMDIIGAEDVRDLVLVDLDFDDIPELIIYRGAIIDIYRISGNELKFIDALNINTRNDMGGNAIPLVVTEDGEKVWLLESTMGDSLWTGLQVNFLVFKGDEIILTEFISIVPDEESDLSEDAEYFFMGERIVFDDSEQVECPYTNDGETMITLLKWGEYDSIFGKFFIIDYFRQEYFKDLITEAVRFKDFNNTIDELVADIVNIFFTYGNAGVLEPHQIYMLGAYGKPVVYLYPEEVTDVEVLVTFPNGGWFTASYPDYAGGWSVTAHPDGTLINHADGREYSYLYWAGKGPANWDFSSGFVVKGSDTVAFLQEKLEYLGLIPREYNEFIVYYLPLLQKNEYNLITFQTTVYEQNAVMHITPEPDSILRIFMAYMPLEAPVNIPEQKLERFERTGFSVIEWGGTEVN